MAKILVCENWQDTGSILVEECEKDEHEARLLTGKGDCDYFFENLPGVVQEFQPDYMIIDHLMFRCFEAIDIAKRIRPSLVTILHTTHIELSLQAEERGIPFYEKHNFQALDNMFWYILEEERKK